MYKVSMFSVKTTLTRTKTTTIPHQQQTISMRKKQRHQQHKNHCGGGGSGSGGCGGDGGCFIGAIIQVLCLQNCDDNGCSFKKNRRSKKYTSTVWDVFHVFRDLSITWHNSWGNGGYFWNQDPGKNLENMFSSTVRRCFSPTQAPSLV